MFLTPSSINFTNCTGQATIEEMTSEKDIEQLTRKYIEKGYYPKLQVAEKEGRFYTLNNTQLQVFRRLEKDGHCKRVKVECISIKRIPEGIQEMMTVPNQTFKTKDCAKICKGDYQKLQTKETAVHEKTHENEDESEDERNDSESLSSDSLEESSSEDDSEDDFDDFGDFKPTCNGEISSDDELEEEKESLL